MPINLDALTRDLRGIIADIPATMRVGDNPVIACSVNGEGGILSLLEGGTVDDWTGTITCVRGDLVGEPPLAGDVIELQIRGGAWRAFVVITVPEALDPFAVSWSMTVGSPNARN